MPDPLVCKCGKKLRIRPELAGRPVKCPACGHIQVAPATPQAESPAATDQSSAFNETPPQATTSDWYYAQGGQALGPFSLAEMQQLIAAGTLGPADLVWSRTQPGWVSARQVLELFPVVEPPPPPPPVQDAQPADGSRQAVSFRRLIEVRSGSPVTNDHLPWMGNAICVYGLVVGPVLWVMDNLSCCLVGTTYREDTGFYDLEILMMLVEAVVASALTAWRAWGAWRLRKRGLSGKGLVQAALIASVTWPVISSVMIEIPIMIAAVTSETSPYAEDTPAGTMVSCFRILLSLSSWSFELVALIWLIWYVRVPTGPDAHRAAPPGDPLSSPQALKPPAKPPSDGEVRSWFLQGEVNSIIVLTPEVISYAAVRGREWKELEAAWRSGDAAAGLRAENVQHIALRTIDNVTALVGRTDLTIASRERPDGAEDVTVVDCVRPKAREEVLTALQARLGPGWQSTPSTESRIGISLLLVASAIITLPLLYALRYTRRMTPFGVILYLLGLVVFWMYQLLNPGRGLVLQRTAPNSAVGLIVSPDKQIKTVASRTVPRAIEDGGAKRKHA